MTTQRPWLAMLTPSLMIIGLGFLGLGWTWSSVVPSSAYWGPQQAQEYTTAQVELHATEDTHTHDQNHERDVAAAHERFNKIHQQLELARDSRNHTGRYLAGAGMLFLITGIGIYLATRPSG
jgi:ABC-type nickel/cobalt efflux system permease component RcnA